MSIWMEHKIEGEYVRWSNKKRPSVTRKKCQVSQHYLNKIIEFFQCSEGNRVKQFSSSNQTINYLKK